ncbi:MAG: (E)-4-hydroxy-3-methylbut-2-enyl-diphosphate synthase [Prevotella sp.]|nr:(E)-4-hydroxy-3-methylbut-2-enyl-diphosphate synthase [Prevotella sp.]
MNRRHTTTTRVGNITIGGDNPIRVQSMTTTNTNDTTACVEQAKRIISAGGELVRLTTQGRREAENMANISAALRAEGYDTPLVADVHFNANVADIAARHCQKVRINPGNYVDPARTFKKLEYTDDEYSAELQKIEQRFIPFLDICRANGTAIRIGVNHGSLSDRIMSRYGDTPEGIVESCMEFLRICQREQFHNVVLSIKASNTVVMVTSVRLLVKAMEAEGMCYPLHLGVTEAGEGEDGRIKSAVGIGALLTEGIGDTIRVSLSEEPECEIPVARKLVQYAPQCAQMREEAHIEGTTLHLHLEEDNAEDLQLKAAMTAGALLIDRRATDLQITNQGWGTEEELRSLADAILQAARVKFTKTEYISCPGCGRTLYDLQGTIARIKAAVREAAKDDPRFATLKIGIMGCIVNGPGEMADADYGYVGAGPAKISLYKGKECVEKAIPEAEAVDRLLAYIKNDK